MKKLLTVMILALCLCVAFAAADGRSVVGHWEGTEGRTNGMTLPLSAVGIVFEVDFAEDGTYTMNATYNGEELHTSGTWSQSGSSVTISGNATCEWEGDNLIFTTGSSAFVMVRTGEAAPAPVTAPVADTGSLAGTWTLTRLEYEGMSLDPAAFGMGSTIVLREDGTVTLTIVNDGETQTSTSTWRQNGSTVIMDDVTATLEDGEMHIESQGLVMVYERDEAPAADSRGTDDVTGMWVMTRGEVAGMSMDAATLGMYSTIMLNEDGTCTLATTQDGKTDTYDGAWTRDGDTLNLGGVTATLEGGEMRIEISGVTLVYERSGN